MVARPELTIAHSFVRPPYGGSNQFLLALRGEFKRRGIRVSENIAYRNTRGIIVNAFLVDVERLSRIARRNTMVIHRVDGPVSTYRGFDDGTDRRVMQLNKRFADATVFQSQYSLQANLARGFEFRRPLVIHNAVDPTIFYQPEHPPATHGKVRLIATAWSDNPNKGSATFRWLEDHLDWSRFEFTFVGRLSTPLRRARVIPPVDSHGVAHALREHDLYVMASLHEACSNALLEALACGLPAVYVDSGSNAELVGDAGVPFTDGDSLLAAIDKATEHLAGLRERISIPTIDDVASRYLNVLGVGHS